MKSEMTVDSFGTKRWKFQRRLHREDGPAIETVVTKGYWAGHKSWWLDGMRYTESKWLNKVLFDKVYIEIV